MSVSDKLSPLTLLKLIMNAKGLIPIVMILGDYNISGGSSHDCLESYRHPEQERAVKIKWNSQSFIGASGNPFLEVTRITRPTCELMPCVTFMSPMVHNQWH